VRGYNENQFVRDKAVTLSLESRLPLVQDKLFADYLQIVPFFDYGWADTENLAIPGPDEIYSVGVGLRWAVTLPPPLRLRPMVEVYYGKKLNQVEGEDSNNLQDKGIHFQIALSAF
jgi:hemolysin activation/secretion protein